MSASNHPDSILYAWRALRSCEAGEDYSGMLFWVWQINYRLQLRAARMSLEETTIKPLLERLVTDKHLPKANYLITWENAV